MKIIVKGNTIRYIYDDALNSFNEHGLAQTVRASYVESIDGLWWADLAPSGGPKLGPFKLRSEALKAEVAWLTENNIPLDSSQI